MKRFVLKVRRKLLRIFAKKQYRFVFDVWSFRLLKTIRELRGEDLDSRFAGLGISVPSLPSPTPAAPFASFCQCLPIFGGSKLFLSGSRQQIRVLYFSQKGLKLRKASRSGWFYAPLDFEVDEDAGCEEVPPWIRYLTVK